MLDIQLPFSGFYNSLHDLAIDEAVNKHTCWLLKQTAADKYKNITELSEFDGDTPPDTIRAMVSDLIDYEEVFENISKTFVEYFNEYTELGKLGILIKFKGLWSPREYNYATDKITCQISEADFKKLFDQMRGTESFEIALKELEPRPGFVPFHSCKKDWWFDNFTRLDDSKKYVLGYLCLKALAIKEGDGTWENCIWEGMEGNDEYGAAVAKYCDSIKAAFKIGMFVQEKSTTGEI